MRTELATSSGKAGWYPESSTCFGRWALTPSKATCQLGAQDKSLQLSLLFCKIRIHNPDLILLCIANGDKGGKASGKEPAMEKELDWWYFPYHISFNLLPPGKMIEGQQNAFIVFPILYELSTGGLSKIELQRVIQDRMIEGYSG